MAVNTSQQANDITTKDFTYYTGIIPFKIVALNPNMDQLKAMGIDYLKNDPEYLGKDFSGEKEQMLLRFYLENRSFNYKNEEGKLITVPAGEIKHITLDFRVTKGQYIGSNTGKGQYVNKYGRTAWALPTDLNNLDTNPYFINEDSRPAFYGEEDLYKFFFAWGNMIYNQEDKFDECRIDINKIFDEDLSEIKALIDRWNTYTVKILLGFNVTKNDAGDKRVYSKTYAKYFLKHNQNSFSYFQNFVNKEDKTGQKRAAFKVSRYDWKPTMYTQQEAFDYYVEKDSSTSMSTPPTSDLSNAKNDDIPF